ncbi:DUF4418 family protein [Actinomyces sp.]|uniref:DUF4418 family protein n=1 Tax=Actinomyces sp. TaxID=29317 RepID=UPI0026DCE520|nr:DUF4418 family protein [Actinomyces sp.]MDO4901624.1 DUF4418 family protein [Actinomyces sp.]
MRKKNIVVSLLPAALGLLLLLGVLTVFSACGPKDDGSWMRCHDCQNAVAAGAGALAVLFGAAAFVPSRAARIGLQAVGVIGAVVVFFIPGAICPMCMLRTMRCYTVFQPFVRIMTALIAGSGLLTLLVSWRRRGTA